MCSRIDSNNWKRQEVFVPPTAPKPLLLAARSRCARQERNRSPQALAYDRVVVGEENPGRV
jgi:hypothetical protein